MAPLPSSSKTSKAAASAVGDSMGKKKLTNRRKNFSIYIYKVLQESHPNASISCKSMSIINSFLNDIFERVATEAGQLVQRNEKCTITSHDIQTAVRLVLPGQLARHAISEGSKAVSMYNSSEE